MNARVIAGTCGKIVASKYHAKRTVVDGVQFASMKESRRYLQLKLLEKAGRIKDLELQPRYELVVNDVKIGRYTGDFRYLELDRAEWKLVVEDSKGYSKASRDYPLRIKLMKALYGIEVRET